MNLNWVFHLYIQYYHGLSFTSNGKSYKQSDRNSVVPGCQKVIGKVKATKSKGLNTSN